MALTNLFNRFRKPKEFMPPLKRKHSVEIIDPSRAIKSSTNDVFSRNVLDFISGNSQGISGYYSEQQLLGAYLSSVYAFAAVRRVANLISRLRFVAEIQNEEGQFIRAPEGVMINRIFQKDGSEVLARMWYNYAIYGASVAYKVPTRRAVQEEARGLPIYRYSEGAVGGLYVIDKPKWDIDEDISGTEINGLHVMQYHGNDILSGKNYLERDEFVYTTDWNPESPNRGKPLIAVAIHEAVANSAIAQWMSDYFTRGAMPFIVVSMEDDPDLITDSDLMKYKRQFEEYWQGINSSLRSVFLDRKVSVEQVGINASDIAAPELNETALEGIASVIGIDRKLIVTTDGGSYSEHRQLVKRAWEDTVIPLGEKFLSSFNRDLGLPPNMRLVIDLSNISELEADRDERSSTEISIYESGLQDYNETRTRLNQPPIKALDNWFNHDGKITPIEKILATKNIPAPELQEYVAFLWDNNLARKGFCLKLLGMELEVGDKDGYRRDFDDLPDFITGLWAEDLLTRRQVLNYVGYDLPQEADDGYRSELERGADYGEFITSLWSDNLLTRSQTMQLLSLDVQVPENAPDGYADEIGNRKDNYMSYWEGNLMQRSDVIKALGLPASEKIIDGFVDEVNAIVEKQSAKNDKAVELWGENLLTKKQVLDALSIPSPENLIDGYLADVEAVSETLIEFKVDDMKNERKAKMAKIEAEQQAELQKRQAQIAQDVQSMATQSLDVNESDYSDSTGDWLMNTPVDEAVSSAEEDMLLHYGENTDDVITDETPLHGSYGDLSDVYPPQSLPTDGGDNSYFYTDEDIDKLLTNDYYENSAIHTDVVIEEQELYATLWLPNEQSIYEAQQQMKELFKDAIVEWQTPETYHITLVYVPDINDEQFQQVRTLMPQTTDKFNLNIEGLGVFDIGEQSVLYLNVNHDDALMRLQKRLAEAFTKNGIELSEFSIPDSYNPHITLGYIDGKIDTPTNTIRIQLSPQQVLIGRDDYDFIDEIYFTDSNNKAVQKDALDELRAWEKVALRKGMTKAMKFETIHIDPSISENIRTMLQLCKDKDDIKSMFNTIREGFDKDDD